MCDCKLYQGQEMKRKRKRNVSELCCIAQPVNQELKLFSKNIENIGNMYILHGPHIRTHTHTVFYVNLGKNLTMAFGGKGRTRNR